MCQRRLPWNVERRSAGPAQPAAHFLLKIVRNISLNRYWSREAAKRGSRFAVALEEIEPCLPGRDSVEGEVEARELARILEEFLDTFTPENRTIFLRRYWFADSCREIAGAVGLSEKNVSVRLTRIRSRLKRHLAEQEGRV